MLRGDFSRRILPGYASRTDSFSARRCPHGLIPDDRAERLSLNLAAAGCPVLGRATSGLVARRVSSLLELVLPGPLERDSGSMGVISRS